MYVNVVFPLPFRKSFTYSVPDELRKQIQIGVRVAAPFGKRTLTGFVIELPSKPNSEKEKIKKIYDVLDELPVFDEVRTKFYFWLSEYYMCSYGEALKLAVPAGTEIESKKIIYTDVPAIESILQKNIKQNSNQYKILKELSRHNKISFKQLKKIIKKKNIYSIIRTLTEKGVISVIEETASPKVKVKTVKIVKLALPLNEIYDRLAEIELRAPKQVSVVLEAMNNRKKDLMLSELLKKTKASLSTVRSLEKKGIIKICEKEIERKYEDEYSEQIKQFTLTNAQNEAINSVLQSVEQNKFEPYLFYGVTGSGKTQVYIELISKVLERNKTALLLVPEISLTPQITSRLINNFGEAVSVIHSKMSAGERFDSWRRINSGKSKVVIGARSALFAPLKDIGLIIVDEEHDASYKQSDSTPKYNARDCAVVLAKLYNAPVVLGSATPSLESMYNVQDKKYKLLLLPERVDNANLPKISLVNIKDQPHRKASESVITKILLDKIEDRLKKKEGVIILQNRRGFSTQIYCTDCGEIETCENCAVPMVYHINKNKLECHYCGLTKKVPDACNICGSYSIKYFGTGTERVEDELEYFFPNAKIKRVDSDSVSRKNSLSQILFNFSKGDIDILVGTQMVSKGLDFSRVTLVGVIAAETTLWLPDFRADERTFQLLTQVAGRSGRSTVPGEVIIQTYNEKNFTLQKVVQNDYQGFFQCEIKKRKELHYPPFTRLALIESKDLNESRALNALTDYYNQISKYGKYLKISPPTCAILSKLKGFYRFQILVKSDKKNDKGGFILRKAIMDSYIEFNRKSRFKDIKLLFDIDPQSII